VQSLNWFWLDFDLLKYITPPYFLASLFSKLVRLKIPFGILSLEQLLWYIVPISPIFDINLELYKKIGAQFEGTTNIADFLKSLFSTVVKLRVSTFIDLFNSTKVSKKLISKKILIILIWKFNLLPLCIH